MVVPLFAHLCSVWHTARGGKRLDYLIPQAELCLIGCLFLEKLLIALKAQCVVFEKEGVVNVKFVYKIKLSLCKFVLLLNTVVSARKTHDIRYFHFYSPMLNFQILICRGVSLC